MKGKTYSVITNTNCRCNVSERPQAAFRKVEPLFLKILKFLLNVNQQLEQCVVDEIHHMQPSNPYSNGRSSPPIL